MSGPLGVKKFMIESFTLAIVPESQDRFKEIIVNDGENWMSFIQSLGKEYFMEDIERVTKRSFLEWIARANKGLPINELL
jgi:hypothetical protein